MLIESSFGIDQAVQKSPKIVLKQPFVSKAMVTNLNKSETKRMLGNFLRRRPGPESLIKHGILKSEPVFGVTLREMKGQDLILIMTFLSRCVQLIEDPSILECEGIYRKPGIQSRIQEARYKINQGDLDCLEKLDPVDKAYTLTGILKLFFRELKEPLISWEIFEKVGKSCPDKPLNVEEIRSELQKMPDPHYGILARLLKHLKVVSQYHEKNMMKAQNLAVCFSPSLIWAPQHLALHSMSMISVQNTFIEFILEYCIH